MPERLQKPGGLGPTFDVHVLLCVDDRVIAGVVSGYANLDDALNSAPGLAREMVRRAVRDWLGQFHPDDFPPDDAS